MIVRTNIEEITQNYTTKLKEFEQITLDIQNSEIREREAKLKLQTVQDH